MAELKLTLPEGIRTTVLAQQLKEKFGLESRTDSQVIRLSDVEMTEPLQKRLEELKKFGVAVEEIQE